MSIHVVVNPAGASGRAWDLWQKASLVFQEKQMEYTLHQSTLEHGVEEICRELTGTGEEVDLIIVGGDGTINQAVNGIEDFEHTRLGFLPCGSGNDLARDIELPKDLREIISILEKGETRRVCDLAEVRMEGTCKWFDHEDLGEGPYIRRFHMSCGIGFDAKICAGVQRSRWKGFLNRMGLGMLSYGIVSMGAIFTTKPIPMKLTVDGREIPTKRGMLLAAMNHRYQGGGVLFAPDAKADDGLLDCCYVRNVNRLKFFGVLPMAYSGKHLLFKGITIERGKEIDLETAIPLWAHTDGEVVCKASKFHIRVLPERLKMLV